MGKRIDYDWMLANPEICDWWSTDKVDRESAWINLVFVLEQLTEVTSSEAADWRLPNEVNLAPVKLGESRMTLRTGETVRFHEESVEHVVTQVWNCHSCARKREHWGIIAALDHIPRFPFCALLWTSACTLECDQDSGQKMRKSLWQE